MNHFKTIDKAVENVLIKEKKSKFIGFAYPIFSIEDAKEKINQIKKNTLQLTTIVTLMKLG